jgi:hypothetical protein
MHVQHTHSVQAASKHSPPDVHVNVWAAPGAEHGSVQTESRSRPEGKTVQSVLYSPLAHGDDEHGRHTFVPVESLNPLMQRHALMLLDPATDVAFDWHGV